MAETRTIRTVLELNAQRFNQGAASAAASAKTLSGELARITDANGGHRAEVDRVANSLLGFGAAAATGLGLASKASMDWESAWAGVTKTIDGTPEQLGQVEDGLRGLARELPASHQEIAAVAEAAGALGVQTESVVDFTRTMVNLGETTNLSADEAATSLARFSNIMGTSQDDVDRLGAALVGLGNAGASTEQEIMQMGLRLAGTGAQIGLTEGEVLGLANAMSSVGIEAEAGGTAMSMGMRKIDAAVREGGDSLAGFAEVAGMTNEEFARLWSQDSAEGIDVFVQGLARISSEGGDVSGVLSDLGIKGIRESDTFLRLAGAADMLGESLAQGNTEFERNLALTEEAAKRYETTESQLQIARNALVDAGIDIGAQVLPVLADAASGVADLAEWFAALPEPVQSSVTQLGAAAAVSGLLAGGLMRAVPAAMETVQAFKRLRTEAPGAASAIGRVGKAVGITAVALTGLSMLSDYGDSLTDFAIGANEAADMAMKTADAVDPLQTVFSGMGEEAFLASAGTEEMADTLGVLANGGVIDWTSDKLAGLANVFGANISTMDDARARLEEYGQGLAGLAQTDLPAAAASFERLWVEGFGGGEQAGVDLLDTMPALRDELIGLANAAELPTDDLTLLKIASGELVPELQGAEGASGEFGDAVGDATGEVEEQVDALEELQNLLEDTANLLLGVRGSERDFQAAIDDANASVEEHGKTLDRSTEAGRANEAALDGVAAAAHSWADAAEESGASAETLDGIMRDGREAFLEAADAMGIGEEEAAALADELQLIPDFVSTEVEIETEQARADWDALWDDLGYNPPEMPVSADTTPADEEVGNWTGLLSDQPPTDVPVGANIEPATMDIVNLENTIAASGGTVTINGDATPGDQVLDTLMGIINSSDGTVTIDGNEVPADQALAAAIQAINDGRGVVEIDGDASDAEAKGDTAARTRHATIEVDADTAGANQGINNAARDRRSTIRVSYSVVGGVPTMRGPGWEATGMAAGGWLNSGLSGGGWVPGPYPGPGVDNVIWPMAGRAGGGMLGQPLAGTEFVVNGASAQQWGPALEAINSGVSRAELAALIGADRPGGGFNLSQQINGLNAYEVARESTTQMRHVVRAEAVPLA